MRLIKKLYILIEPRKNLYSLYLYINKKKDL